MPADETADRDAITRLIAALIDFPVNPNLDMEDAEGRGVLPQLIQGQKPVLAILP